eukprot:1142166-Pelagomonas_calceolata.AAC.4
MPAGGSGVGGHNGGMMHSATRAVRAGHDIAPILPELMPGLQRPRLAGRTATTCASVLLKLMQGSVVSDMGGFTGPKW